MSVRQRLTRVALGSLLVALLVATACVPVTWGQTIVYPSQLNPRNTRSVSSTNAAVSVTITGVTNAKTRLQGITAYCSAGTSTITVTEASVTTWSLPSAYVTTSPLAISFWPARTTAPGATLVVTLATCGSGNTGTLEVQAEQS